MERGNRIDWANVENLYSELNTARKKWSVADAAVPENPGIITPQPVSNLKTLIDGMGSITYLSSVANTNSISEPRKGSLITPIEFKKIEEKIEQIQNTCMYDSTFYSTQRSSYYSSDYSTDRSSRMSTDYGSDFGSSYSTNSQRSSNYNDLNAIYNSSRYNSDADYSSYKGSSYSFS